ncbi:MAG: hypothetical protein ACYTHJ_13665 [Planctomycetota bacterium]|jgi:hypothetical protein
MLDWWFDNGTYQVLHEDLTIGRNSAWQGSVLAGLFNIDASDSTAPIVTYRTNTKCNRQYFKLVRRGVVRVEAASDGSDETLSASIPQSGVITSYALKVAEFNPVSTVSQWGVPVAVPLITTIGMLIFRNGRTLPRLPAA